jgi:hypothetical protein
MNKNAYLVTRVAVRRVLRHPITQRTFRSSALLKKHVVRSATLGLVPDAINDVAFHHAQLDVSEIMHVIQDTASITTITTLLAMVLLSDKGRSLLQSTEK